jgi:HemY protein
VLVQDPGYVLSPLWRDRLQHDAGRALLIGIAALLGVWLAWKVLSLPFVAFRRHRKKQARAPPATRHRR